jgi:hypothetical protein
LKQLKSSLRQSKSSLKQSKSSLRQLFPAAIRLSAPKIKSDLILCLICKSFKL